MLDAWPGAGCIHRQQIEAILVTRTAMPQHPYTGYPRDITLLSPAHGFQAASAYSRSPSLDLYEGNGAPLPGDEIDVMTAEPETMRFDGPAAGCEITDCDALTLQAEQLPSILPFGDRGEPARQSHAPC